MTYKAYDCSSYTIHTIKTDKFKTCQMEIIFRKPINKATLPMDALLVDVLTETSQKYPTRKEVIERFEELYRTSCWGVVNRIGNVLLTNFITNFISPVYINEDDYLENVLSLPFEMILNPNALNDEFEEKNFKICQKRNIVDAKSILDDSFRLSIQKSLELVDSPTSYNLIGTPEDIAKITPSSLYQQYKKLLKENTCDIFLIGNIDMDEAVKIIKKYFKKRVINKEKLESMVNNEIRKKELVKSDKSKFIQTNLNILYNITNLTDYEKDVVFNLYNFILGSGGMISKLYQEIREKKSYCYEITSMYLKNDQLLLIHIALDNKNSKNAIKLTKKIIKDMMQGKFTIDDIETAKKSFNLALNLALDNEVTILNNYVFHVFENLPLIEDRLDLINKCTKEDIMKVAKKIKINAIYALEGKDEN